MTFTKLYFCLIGGIALLQLTPNAAFTTQHVLLGTSSSHTSSPLGPLFALHSPGRSSSRSGKERSKRQERVSQLVQTELGKILHSGLIKGDVDYLEDDLRQRISIVSVDVSPDLRQARISTSVRGDPSEERNVAIDKRRAYSWLVSNTKNIRHTLAQKMSHMKTSPNLSFVQVDVAAAVDVMYLIDKVSNGYTRENVGDFGGDDDSLPRGYVEGMDFDEEFDEEEWEEEDDDFNMLLLNCSPPTDARRRLALRLLSLVIGLRMLKLSTTRLSSSSSSSQPSISLSLLLRVLLLLLFSSTSVTFDNFVFNNELL